MGCENIGGAILCRPATTWWRRVMFCPTCGRRRRMVAMIQEWYDPVVTCCACGESWEGGERLQRPFARGWRQAASARARRHWADA